MKNTQIQNSSYPERLNDQEFHNPCRDNEKINEQDFSFSKNL